MVSWWPPTDSSTEILPSSNTIMSHFTEIMGIGLRWFANVAVRLLFTGMIFKVVLVVLAAYLLLHPVLRGISKRPLLTYLGMEYGDINLSPSRLKLTITDMELLPSRSSTLQSIILALFPSSHVQSNERINMKEYPESRITVSKLSIKIRVSSLAGPTQDGDPCTTNNSSHPHTSLFGNKNTKADADLKAANLDGNTRIKWILNVIYHFIPRPILIIRLKDVSIEIEKAYLASEPPTEFRSISKLNEQHQLPLAVSSEPFDEDIMNLPTFYQDHVIDGLMNEEVVEADTVTFFLKRWIDHSKTKMKQKSDSSKDAKDDSPKKQQLTPDERMNAWISWAAAKLLHFISLDLQNVSVIISGASAEVVKETRKVSSSPREANLTLAKLPRRQRALTVVESDSISLSFSPDSNCNALLCFVGAHLKVGSPIMADGSSMDNNDDVPYAWHTVAHPFHLVAEIKGILPFIIYATNYDHDWQKRELGLNLSASEIAVSLSPEHLHTVLLHLDDYTDPLSPYNSWILWLKDIYCQKTFDISDLEKKEYCNNYARIMKTASDKKKKKKKGAAKSEPSENGHNLSVSQMKDMEKRMTRYQIMSLRCFAMRKEWTIPKADQNFDAFLRCSRSSISMENDDESPCSDDEEQQSPFERTYPTPLHALVGLIRSKSSFLSPHVRVEYYVQTLHLDFPQTSTDTSIPSSITVSGVSFEIDQENIIFLRNDKVSDDALKCPRLFLDLSLGICAVKWDVVINDDMAVSLNDELPIFRDKSHMGIVYMDKEAVSSKQVLSLGLSITVMPTIDQEQHFDFQFNACDLVVLVNPLPTLSAIQMLIDLLDIPFQPPEEIISDINQSDDDDEGSKDEGTNETGVTAMGIQANIVLSVENIQLLFLVDRKKVTRGILQLMLYGMSIKFESGGMSGKLLLATEPLVLRAGQIGYVQSSRDECIETTLMPYQPLADIDGAKIQVHAKEEYVVMKGTQNQPLPESNTTVRLNILIGTESLFFNTSPSLIVAFLGVLSSMDPFLDWLWGGYEAKEAERKRMEAQKKTDDAHHVIRQREVLRQIFVEVDTDESGELSDDELELVVLKLFEQHNTKKNTRAGIPTQKEVMRERDYLLATIDQNRTNDITFQEMDGAFFRLANEIDDVNLTPMIKDDDEKNYNDHFQCCDSFFSGPFMRKLVYFDDLREFSSSSEVFRITGDAGLGFKSHFPAPSLWRLGLGIDLFWELYERETGCSRQSLNGQDIDLVQRKLVRSLCNYEFAKFCWKTLVQPALYSASNNTAVHWLLDEDSTTSVRSGVMDRLLKHIDTEATKKDNSDAIKDVQYEISLGTSVGSAILRFGSSHTFTNPLFEARFSHINMNASALMSSQSGWFVPAKEMASTEQDERKENQISFNSMVSAIYLNTKHNHMESFIEPYPTFGKVTYQVLADGADNKATSYSIHLDCPRFLNINTSRSFFETASVLKKVVAQSDPDTFIAILFDRDIRYIKNFWDAWDTSQSGSLCREDTLAVLCSVIDMHWKDEVAGLTPDEVNNLANSVCNLAEQQGGGRGVDGLVSFESLKSAFRVFTSRCYFSGSKELQVKNNIGRELRATTKANFDNHRMKHSIKSSDLDYQMLPNTFVTIYDANSGAIPVSGRLALATKGYKLIDDIPVSPYQSLMFPLKHRKRGSSRKRRSASGFSPYLTVVPKADSLDAISLDVRTSVHIRTEIPVKIRIVRLGKGEKAGIYRKKGAKKKLDLSKKGIMAALRRAVEGASIVYERSGVKEGDVAPLPLDVLDSSHYHVLLIQPIIKKDSQLSTSFVAWRDPVLLTKEFLFNPTNLRDVKRCHTLSGIVVNKERLNVHLPDKRGNFYGDSKRSILKRTAWDVTIQVVPFFLLSNSLTFPIVVRTWQLTSNDEDDELWDEPLLLGTSAHGANEGEESSDEDLTYATPSIVGGRELSEDIHLSSGRESSDHYSQDNIAVGQTLRLSGVNLTEPLFIQVSQNVNSSEEVQFMWTNPLLLDLSKMRSGINTKGVQRLPKLILDLGNHCDCLIDVTLEEGLKVPVCTIYSPYWIMNKTGVKLEYKVSRQAKRYLDSGAGGLPIMIHGSESENEKYKNVSRAIAVMPLERPSLTTAEHWWDTASNGSLVLQKGCMLEKKGQILIKWSENIDLDAAGTSGEINCSQFVFNVSIDSLAGAFHRSNLITLAPRFIVKNMLHIGISVLPLSGGLHDALQKTKQLREALTEQDKKIMQDLFPDQSIILFNFHNISRGLEKPYRWVAFRVNAARYGASYKPKWHLVPADLLESRFFGEHDGCYDTMCGILEAKVHTSDGNAVLVSITHATVPPFRIENRSSDQYIRFVQDDSEAVVFELAPMSSATYAWDSPLGKKKLRAVVIRASESKSIQLDETLKRERDEQDNETEDKEAIDTDSDDDNSNADESTKEPLLHALKKGTRLTSQELNKTARFRSPQKKAVFTMNSRSYGMKKTGRQRDLPCPSPKENEPGHHMSSNLFAHIRIVAGTKTLSFSDSTWLADQVEAGQLKQGGNFKTARVEVNIEGLGIYIMDDFPREVMAVVLRDIQFLKPRGSIKADARVRHFQVDAMLPDARYPIIIQPSPMGVDRRKPMMKDGNDSNSVIPEGVKDSDCFWRQNEEKPVPVFEIEFEFVPQRNMTWVPSLEIAICPLKLWIDVDYILRILGMVVSSVFKYQEGVDLSATSNANDQLHYVTRGQVQIFMTYIEKLYISPVQLDCEINIKPDDQDHTDHSGDSNLTLHSIAQATNSASVAGILSWVINVGANFAHVSPTFRFSHVSYSETYCALFDLIEEISGPYINQTIQQGYKVIFSMQLLGDPSKLLFQYKSGVKDLFTKTRDEIAAGGQDGIGKGVTSLLQNVVGGTFFAVGKITGGAADTIDSATTNDLTSKHMKPKAASSGGKHPDNAVDGVYEGTRFLGETVVHGIAGLIGNPYRGAKTGTISGVSKGVASGITGFVAAPFVGALGFIAKTADGIGATTKYLELGVFDAKCRPARIVPWGRPMSDIGLSYLKAIGIRIHTVRYQKIRKRFVKRNDQEGGDEEDDKAMNSREYKRLKAAEERRKNPPRKLVSIMHEKDKYHYITSPVRPKLLTDAPGNLVLSHYAVTFEETLILRSTDLQLGDTVSINIWNNRGIKATTTRATPLGVCKISVGDMYYSVLSTYEEQLRRKESNLSTEAADIDSLIVPPPQECAMFRPSKAQTKDRRDIFDAIGEELAAIEKSEEDNFVAYDSSSESSDSDISFLDGGGKKTNEEDPADIVKANERLFGSISLSFFPVPW